MQMHHHSMRGLRYKIKPGIILPVENLQNVEQLLSEMRHRSGLAAPTQVLHR